jgi:hypothetical protein
VKPIVFIHTSDKQMLAAKVGAYSLRARSKHPREFDVQLLRLEETRYLYSEREGRRYLWDKRVCIWHNRDLQSFGPLRMMVPEVVGFEGRALVLDPDIFAVGDVYELLRRDMKGKAILCRRRPEGFYTSAVMLLDCARLKHWRWKQDLDAIFAFRLDMYDWLRLLGENPDTIGRFEDEWNHLDTLNESTMLLHNTERSTQPWKTGLPVDFDLDQVGSYPYRAGFHASDILKRVKQRWLSLRITPLGQCQPHPDPRQENSFVGLLKEAIDRGAVTEEFVADEIQRKHVRADLFELLGTVHRKIA